MKRSRLALIGVVGLALLVGALAGFMWTSHMGTALAADPTPTPPGNSQQTPVGPGVGPFGGPRGFGGRGMMGWGAGFGGPGMMGWAGGPYGSQSVLTILSQKLGLTPQEIQTQHQSGKSLAQIAASKGMDEATLIQTLLDSRKAALDQLVKDGRLTQAQADQAYQSMQSSVKQMVEWTGPASSQPGTTPGSNPGRGFGGCGGPGAGMMRYGASSRTQ